MSSENHDATDVEFSEETGLPAQYEPGLLERLAETHKAALKAIEIIDDMVKTSLRLTAASHWYNHSGKPYLKEGGVMLVKRALPVMIEPVPYPDGMTFQCLDYDDEKGPYCIYLMSFRASWTNGLFGSIVAEGTASTRDPLFGRKNGEDVPLQEVDRGKVMKKCGTNGRRNALMRLLGIQDMTWAQFTELTGLKEDDIEKVDFGGKTADRSKDDDDATAALRKEMREKIVDMCQGDNRACADYLEKLTTFTPRGKSEPVKGKRSIEALTKRQVEINVGKVRSDHAKFTAAQKQGADEQQESGDTNW